MQRYDAHVNRVTKSSGKPPYILCSQNRKKVNLAEALQQNERHVDSAELHLMSQEENRFVGCL